MSEVQDLRDLVKNLQDELRRVSEAAPEYGAIVHVAEDRLVLATTGGAMHSIPKPKKPKLAKGDIVRITGDSLQPVDEVEVARCGKVLNVGRIETNGDVFVSDGPTERLVIVADGVKVTKDDRVLVDPTGNVIVAVLPGSTEFQAKLDVNVTWDSIVGNAEAKLELCEIIANLKAGAKNKVLEAYGGYKPPKGMLLYGPPGCVDGDALVSINRAGKGFSLPLREVVRRFNNEPFTGAANNKTRAYQWDPTIPTMVRCLFGEEFRLRRLVGAYPKGTKPVLKMTLADGKTLRVTTDHEIAQIGGLWTRADALTSGMSVLTNGLPYARTPGRCLDHNGYWWITSGLRYHPFFGGVIHDSYDLPEHRLVAEARENGYSLAQWLDIIRANAFTSEHVFLRSDQEVHHRDEDTTNNIPSNLDVLTKSEHAKAHRFHRHLPVFFPKEVEITTIEPDGEAEVFDLTVEEAHNFVANGVVVHNCGKTMLAKAAATALGSDGFIHVKGPQILDPYVGVAEAKVRELFSEAREYYTRTGKYAVIFVDEADAILRDRNRHHAHMEVSIVPAFLAEMDGLDASRAIVLLATNSPEGLDPAVIREGRIDRKIAVARPTEPETKQLLEMHLAKAPLKDGATAEGLAECAAMLIHGQNYPLADVSFQGGATITVHLRHIVSGALVTAVAEVATTTARRRDMTAGKVSGINGDDVVRAVGQVHRQNIDGNLNGVIAELEFNSQPTKVTKRVAETA